MAPPHTNNTTQNTKNNNNGRTSVLSCFSVASPSSPVQSSGLTLMIASARATSLPANRPYAPPLFVCWARGVCGGGGGRRRWVSDALAQGQSACNVTTLYRLRSARWQTNCRAQSCVGAGAHRTRQPSQTNLADRKGNLTHRRCGRGSPCRQALRHPTRR